MLDGRRIFAVRRAWTPRAVVFFAAAGKREQLVRITHSGWPPEDRFQASAFARTSWAHGVLSSHASQSWAQTAAHCTQRGIRWVGFPHPTQRPGTAGEEERMGENMSRRPRARKGPLLLGVLTARLARSAD